MIHYCNILANKVNYLTTFLLYLLWQSQFYSEFLFFINFILKKIYKEKARKEANTASKLILKPIKLE